jgi:hypothetical protein
MALKCPYCGKEGSGYWSCGNCGEKHIPWYLDEIRNDICPSCGNYFNPGTVYVECRSCGKKSSCSAWKP